jgi:hypothetical protein
MKRWHLIFVFFLLFFPLTVVADDISDQIEEARTAYKKNDLQTALMALDNASVLIRQKKAEAMSTLLPPPLAGWEAEEAESSAAGAAMMGGGTNAERRYLKQTDNGQKEITISITSDSPMIQGMGVMLANPMFMGSGSKMLIIGGKKVAFDKEGNSLQTLVANKVLVAVNGGGEAVEKDLKDYFQAIDFAAIEKMAQ